MTGHFACRTTCSAEAAHIRIHIDRLIADSEPRLA
jgi:hypothetical protein